MTTGRIWAGVLLLCAGAVGLLLVAIGKPLGSLSWATGEQVVLEPANYPVRLTFPSGEADGSGLTPIAEPQPSPDDPGPGLDGTIRTLRNPPGNGLGPVSPAGLTRRQTAGEPDKKPAGATTSMASRESSEPEGLNFAKAFSEFSGRQSETAHQPQANVDLLASKFRLQDAPRGSFRSGEARRSGNEASPGGAN